MVNKVLTAKPGAFQVTDNDTAFILDRPVIGRPPGKVSHCAIGFKLDKDLDGSEVTLRCGDHQGGEPLSILLIEIGVSLGQHFYDANMVCRGGIIERRTPEFIDSADFGVETKQELDKIFIALNRGEKQRRPPVLIAYIDVVLPQKHVLSRLDIVALNGLNQAVIAQQIDLGGRAIRKYRKQENRQAGCN